MISLFYPVKCTQFINIRALILLHLPTAAKNQQAEKSHDDGSEKVVEGRSSSRGSQVSS